MSKKVFITTGILAIVGGVGTTAAVSSCDTVCTTESRSSVLVHIVDESGDPVGADWVRYSVDEENPHSVGSANPGAAGECLNDDCTDWALGAEQEGNFTIVAMVCGREITGRTTVEMTEDGCHVDTEEIVLEADTMNCERPRKVDLANTELVFPEPKDGPKVSAPDPETCSNVAHPSVNVKIELGEISSVPQSPAWGLYYQVDGGPLTSGICVNQDCTEWSAGWEQVGTFDLHAIFENKRISRQVEVEMGKYGCHVDTQDLTISFVPQDLDVDIVDQGPFLTNKPRECSYEARPSVIIDIVDGDSEVAKPVEAKSVWWNIKEIQETTRALCREEPCATWFAGVELAGEFEVHAEVCGKTIHGSTFVEHTTDACHVKTERLTLVADISDCPQ